MFFRQPANDPIELTFDYDYTPEEKGKSTTEYQIWIKFSVNRMLWDSETSRDLFAKKQALTALLQSKAKGTRFADELVLMSVDSGLVFADAGATVKGYVQKPHKSGVA